MTAKYVFYIIIAVALIALVVAAFLNVNKKTETVVNNQYTITPQVTTIIREKIPARIDTTSGHEIASYSEKIKDDDVTVDLAVKYDEQSNLFDINAQIVNLRDSVYVERVITKKPKFIALTGGIGMAVNYDKSLDELSVEKAQVDAGFKIAGKYSVTAFVDTQKYIGLRFGMDF